MVAQADAHLYHPPGYFTEHGQAFDLNVRHKPRFLVDGVELVYVNAAKSYDNEDWHR
jgi:hypothetical protein